MNAVKHCVTFPLDFLKHQIQLKANHAMSKTVYLSDSFGSKEVKAFGYAE